jgi:hypothetical protein
MSNATVSQMDVEHLAAIRANVSVGAVREIRRSPRPGGVPIHDTVVARGPR